MDSYRISETDWKRWKNLADDALDRFYEKTLGDAAKLPKSGGVPKERYRKLVKLVEEAGDLLAEVFDDHSRTTAVLQIARALDHGLVTDAELKPFSQETRAAVAEVRRR